MVMNREEANEKSIMGPWVHVVLISPRETKTEDVFVGEVTKSHTNTHTPPFPKHTINMQQLIKAAEENIADTENFLPA